MKYSILLLALLATPVFAQSTSGSSSSSSSKAALSASQGNAQTLIVQSAAIPANTSTNVHYSGADRSAPTNVTGGFAAGFSSDNCSNTAQVGGSGPGFSVNVGKAVPDKNCVVMRHVDAHVRIASGYAAMGYTNAALYQLDQAAIDDCIADGYAEDSCRKIETHSIGQVPSTVAPTK
jgi:hypothetical protein